MQASTLITPRLAEEAINSRLTCLPIESLPLTQCVGGTLRENIYAERDHPPFDRVTMDGIAVDSESLRRGVRRFRIQATQSAGSPALKDLGHVDEGRVRLTRAGQDTRLDKPARSLKLGDALVFAIAGRLHAVRIEALGVRRGPPAEARALYSELEEG